MPDPGYLGLVRFGAGTGCPCSNVTGAWRVVRAVKIQQGWPYYLEDGALNACLTLSPYGPDLTGYGSTRAMDRWSGLSTGSPLTTRSEDFDWVAAGARALDSVGGAGGTLLLTDPYTFGQLQADCATILDSPEAHPIGLAEQAMHVARVAETASSAAVTAPYTVSGYSDEWAPARHFAGEPQCLTYAPALVPGPVDGRIVVAIEAGANHTGSNTQFDLSSTYKRGRSCVRERLWIGRRGFYSVTRSVRRAVWFGAEEVLASSPTEYFYNQSGWLVVDSGAFDDAWESAATTAEIRQYAVVRIGAVPPAGVGYTTISGPGGGGSSC